jgi:hypothetical protein
MTKQLFFVIGSPYSGRTTWINKNLYNTEETIISVDANTFPNLYNKIELKDRPKISEESIEESRKWCLEEVKTYMTMEIPTQKIILSLIACRPDKWREFIQLAIDNEYEIMFKLPSNKLLYYSTRHNTTMEQYKFIESKIISRYPRDKKEINKKNSKNVNESIMKDTNESTLLKYIVTEAESANAFYLTNRMGLGTDKIKWLEKINEHYKIAILGEIKRTEKKIKDAEKIVEKAIQNAKQEAEQEIKKLAKEQDKLAKEQEQENLKIIIDNNENQYIHELLS